MKAYLLHVRSSLARYALLPLAALGLVILFGRNRFWIGIWPETGAAITATAFFMSLFCAGLAAWTAARADVHGLREQAASAAITPLKLEATRFAAELAWLLTGYLVVLLVAFTATASTSFPPGVLMFSAYAVLGLIWIVLSVAWGWLIGRLLNPVIAGLTAALAWFIFASTVGNSAGATPVSGPPWLELSTVTLVVRLIVVLLFVLAICALPSRAAGPQRYRQRSALTVGALLVVTATLLMTTAQTPRSPTASPVCLRGEIEYCLWPEHEKYLRLVADVDARVADLPLELRLPERIVDYSLSGLSQSGGESAVLAAGDFTPEVDISEGSPWALARGVAAAITGEILAACDPLAPNDPEYRWDQLQAWLDWRLVGGGSPDYTTSAPNELEAAWDAGHRAAATLSDAEQADWAAELIATGMDRYCRAA